MTHQFTKPSFFISSQDAKLNTEVGLEKKKQERELKTQFEKERKKQEEEQILYKTYYGMQRIFDKIKQYSVEGENMILVKEINPTDMERLVLIKENFKFKWIDSDYNDSGIARESDEYLVW